jgi:mycofactocin precursor
MAKHTGTLTTAPSAESSDHESDDEIVVEEMLVEEVSIDGMCGVY